MLYKKRRVLWRAILSVLMVTIGAIPFANFHWTLFPTKPYDPVTGAHPQFVSSPVAVLAGPLAEWTWRITPALTEALVAALAALAIFALLGGPRVCGPSETLCGSCGAILRGLFEARCPACGAPL